MKQQQCRTVALIGRPNVGKSSLFNRLTKTSKAIVDPTPGVTRDRHYERVNWLGHTFMLIDTGGIEGTSDDNMSSLIREQSMLAVEEADFLLFMLDGREGPVGEDHEIARMLRRSSKPVFCVVNKIDTYAQESKLMPPFFELGFDSMWPVSASHGYGVENFLQSFVERAAIDEGEYELPDNTVSIAVIGRPNVGKSSLINRMTGEERMVVSDVPGTTRDSVDTLLEYGKNHYLLIDTAGIRRRGKVREKLEKFSVMKSLAAMERADITLLLIDASEGITEQDTKVIGYAVERGRACMLLVNKWDLLRDDPKQQKWIKDGVQMATSFINYAPVMQISATTGFGIKNIFKGVEKIYGQYSRSFSTNSINHALQKAVEGHAPPLYKGRRVKMYYATQVASCPPTFLVFCNYPKGVHPSFHRYLINQFRENLELDQVPVRVLFRERERKKYGS